MHIALLTAEYPPHPGGVGDYTRRLALALAARGHHLAVVTGANTLPPADAAGPAPLLLPQVGAWTWRCWRDTIAALDKLRPEVLHIQYQTGAYGMHPALNLLPWRLRGLPHRPRVLVTFHDLLEPYLFPKAGRVRCWITRRLARDADAVVVTNAADAATLRAPACGVVVPYRHVHLIPIGSNIPLAPPSAYERQAWRARLGADDNTFLVAYFGLLSRSKGADVLLDALRRLRQADEPRRDVRLLLIGGAATTAPDRAFAAEVAQQIARSGLHEAVIRTGHVSEQEVSAHLLASDAVALPFREGASLRSGSLLAALGHGCAVVTTAPPAGMSGPADAVAELLHPVDGEHLLLVPADDSAALARALRRLADDTALRDRLGAGARALSARTGWEGIAQQHEQMYRQVWQG